MAWESKAAGSGGLDRRYDLDALRAFAMLLGIVLHAALTFVPAAWIVQDSRPNPAFGLLLAVIHGFRMPLFFLISGYFTAMLLRRRGIRGLLRQRAWRILLPCLVGVATIVPLQHAVSAWAMRTADRSAPDDTGTLVDAIRRGDAAAVRARLDAGADPNAVDPALGVHPLVWAAARGDVEMAALLLEGGAEVNGRNRDGNTPLHAAAFLGRVATVEFLLEQGADVRAQGADGGTPMAGTRVDVETTRFISQLLQVDPGDERDLERRRAEVRALLAPRLSLTGEPEGGAGVSEAGVSAGRDGLRAAYGRWLTSPRWRVSVGGWSIHLVQTPTFDHLWFLWFLCWLVPLYALAAWGMGRLGWSIPARSAMPGLVLLSLVPQWFMGIAIPTFGPDTSAGVIPMPHLLLYYGIFFAFGAIDYDAGEAASRVSRRGGLLVSLALMLAFPMGLATMAGGSQALGAAGQVAYAWLMSLGLMGLFRRWLARENRTIRYLSDSSYFLYLTHLPVVIAVQAVVRDWPWPSVPKFLLIVGVVTAALLVVYDTVIRYGLIGRILNGPRHRSGRTASVDGPVATLKATE